MATTELELNETSSHDDIQDVVKAVMHEQRELLDASGSGKGGKPPGSDETPAADAGDPENNAGADEDLQPGEAVPPEWLDDELKEAATALGIEESELSEFASRAELERGMRLLTRNALAAGSKADDNGEADDGVAALERLRGSDGRFLPAEKPAQPPAKEGDGYQFVRRDVWDEASTAEISNLHDVLSTRIARIESKLADAELKADKARFDRMVDELGLPDLFGSTGKETKDQLAARGKVRTAELALLYGLAQVGRTVAPSKSLLEIAARMDFGDQLSKRDRKNLTQRLSPQTRLRMGGGGQKVPPPSESMEDRLEKRYRELERG